MFDTEHVPFRFANIQPIAPMERDEQEIALVEITVELNPLTAELAGEIDDYVRGTLYSRTAVEVNSKLKSATFDLPIRPQQVAVRMAPDQGKASFVIEEAKVTTVKAKRSKKSSAWTLEITFRCSPPSDKHLGLIVDSYLKTRYLTFANATTMLFDDDEKAEKKTRRGGTAAGASESAATH